MHFNKRYHSHEHTFQKLPKHTNNFLADLECAFNYTYFRDRPFFKCSTSTANIIWLNSHIDAHSNTHLSLDMWLMKPAAINNLDRQDKLNYLIFSTVCNTLHSLSPRFCTSDSFNLPRNSQVTMVHMHKHLRNVGVTVECCLKTVPKHTLSTGTFFHNQQFTVNLLLRQKKVR